MDTPSRFLDAMFIAPEFAFNFLKIGVASSDCVDMFLSISFAAVAVCEFYRVFLASSSFSVLLRTSNTLLCEF